MAERFARANRSARNIERASLAITKRTPNAPRGAMSGLHRRTPGRPPDFPGAVIFVSQLGAPCLADLQLSSPRKRGSILPIHTETEQKEAPIAAIPSWQDIPEHRS
jgi:hypothetical protein